MFPEILNIALHAAHLLVIGINLVGWMWPALRLLTLCVQAVTVGFWVGFGLLRGWWGYCPLTDWHWQVKVHLGDTMLPNNYVSYVLERWAGVNLPSDMVQGLIAGSFFMALAASVYSFVHRRPHTR